MASMIEVEAMTHEPSAIENFHADILTHIFSFCEPRPDLIENLPLVCKRFRDLLRTPTAVWDVMRIDLRRKDVPDLDAAKEWFGRRGRAVKTLEINEGDGAVVQQFLDAVLPHVGPLHRLALNDGPLSSRDVHLLTGLQQLQDLELGISLADPAWQQHLIAMTGLTALKSLEIEFDLLDSDEDAVEQFPEFVTELPNLVSLSIAAVEGLPPSLSALQGLTRLRAEMLDPVGFPKCVVGLQALRELHLRWGDAARPVVIPAHIARLHQLRMCVLEGEGSNAYCIRALSQLTALTGLHLNAMALDSIPDWVSQLTNLRDLSMRHNAIYAVPDWLPKALPLLQVLEVAPQTRPLQPLPAAQLHDGAQAYRSIGITVPPALAAMQHLQRCSLTTRLGPVFHVSMQLPQGAACLLHPRSLQGCLVADEAWEVDAVLPRGSEQDLLAVAAMVALLHRTHSIAGP